MRRRFFVPIKELNRPRSKHVSLHRRLGKARSRRQRCTTHGWAAQPDGGEFASLSLPSFSSCQTLPLQTPMKVSSSGVVSFSVRFSLFLPSQISEEEGRGEERIEERRMMILGRAPFPSPLLLLQRSVGKVRDGGWLLCRCCE